MPKYYRVDMDDFKALPFVPIWMKDGKVMP